MNKMLRTVNHRVRGECKCEWMFAPPSVHALQWHWNEWTVERRRSTMIALILGHLCVVKSSPIERLINSSRRCCSPMLTWRVFNADSTLCMKTIMFSDTSSGHFTWSWWAHTNTHRQMDRTDNGMTEIPFGFVCFWLFFQWKFSHSKKRIFLFQFCHFLHRRSVILFGLFNIRNIFALRFCSWCWFQMDWRRQRRIVDIDYDQIQLKNVFLHVKQIGERWQLNVSLFIHRFLCVIKLSANIIVSSNDNKAIATAYCTQRFQMHWHSFYCCNCQVKLFHCKWNVLCVHISKLKLMHQIFDSILQDRIEGTTKTSDYLMRYEELRKQQNVIGTGFWLMQNWNNRRVHSVYSNTNLISTSKSTHCSWVFQCDVFTRRGGSFTPRDSSKID